MHANCDDRPRLDVCVTCQRPGQHPAPHGDEAASGAQLYDALRAADGGDVDIVAVRCLALCQTGCAAVISSPGKWGWLMRDLRAQLAQDVLRYAALYAQSKTGVVMPSRRPESLRHVMVGRFPVRSQEV